MALLSLETVGFSYGNSFRLEDIDLRVERGDFIGIIGPNGSGKSTLIKLMAGYLRPDKGSVCLEGQLLAKLERKAVARKVAVVSQGVQTGFAFTVEEMVRLGRLPHLGRWSNEGPGDAAAVGRALAQTRLEGYRSRLFSRLSGGEAQRVLMAQASGPGTGYPPAGRAHYLHGHGLSKGNVFPDGEIESRGYNCGWRCCTMSIWHLCTARNLWLMRQGRILVKGNPGEVITRENIEAIFGTAVAISPPSRHRSAAGHHAAITLGADRTKKRSVPDLFVQKRGPSPQGCGCSLAK
ncbi:MAG: ABC transporter ATP-binding protein [Bacillota bacterium]